MKILIFIYIKMNRKYTDADKVALRKIYHGLGIISFQEQKRALIDAYNRQKLLLQQGSISRYSDSIELGLMPRELFEKMLSNLKSDRIFKDDEIYMLPTYVAEDKSGGCTLYSWHPKRSMALPTTINIFHGLYVQLDYRSDEHEYAKHFVTYTTFAKLTSDDTPIYPHIYIERKVISQPMEQLQEIYRTRVYNSKDMVSMEFANENNHIEIYDNQGNLLSSQNYDQITFSEMITNEYTRCLGGRFPY